MNCRLVDVIVTYSTAIVAAATPILIDPASDRKAQELQFLLLPLIGSMIVAGGMVMLNPNPETRRVVIGRSTLALFFGATVPQIMTLWFPWLEALSIRPAGLLVIGGVISGLFYIISKSLVKKLYERSDGISDSLLDRLQTKFVSKENSSKTTTTDENPK